VTRPPKVSVVMPVRNGVAFMDEAIQSICNQTWRDWELIVIDDGSDDHTPDRLEHWARIDARIKVLRQNKLGIVAALNAGIRAARGVYLARMDADDLARPSRLARQVALMDRRPALVVCGSAIQLFGTRHGILCPPKSDWGCRGRLIFENCFAHPSVMVRLSIMRNENILYDDRAEYAEDFDLWVKLADFGEFCNIPMPLLKYRVHANQISCERAMEQHRGHADIVVRQLVATGINMSREDFLNFRWPLSGRVGLRAYMVLSWRTVGQLHPLLWSRYSNSVIQWLLVVFLSNTLKYIWKYLKKCADSR
jgi:glycosyltransferase involved in cell wall biosynthesis